MRTTNKVIFQKEQNILCQFSTLYHSKIVKESNLQNVNGSKVLMVRLGMYFLFLSNYEKNIKRIPFEGHFTKYLTCNFQYCQGHQK